MTKGTLKTVGVDISKAYLDVHELPFRTVGAVHQRRGAGFKKNWRAGSGRTWSGWFHESTGPWHRDFEEALGGPVAAGAGQVGPPDRSG